MAVKIRTVKKTDTARRKYVRWSTSGANVDACSGNRANLPIATIRPASAGCKRFFIRAEIPAEDDQQEHAAYEGEGGAGEAHHVHGDGSVFSGGGIVVETEEQELIDGVADFVLRCLDQPQPD